MKHFARRNSLSRLAAFSACLLALSGALFPSTSVSAQDVAASASAKRFELATASQALCRRMRPELGPVQTE